MAHAKGTKSMSFERREDDEKNGQFKAGCYRGGFREMAAIK